MALAVIVMVGMVVAVAGGNCQADDNVLMQMNQDRGGSLATGKRSACDSKPFPCSNPAFANFPLQQINLGSPDNKVTFSVLDLTTGNYESICEIPNVELNACGINPSTDEIYCMTRDTPRQLVRIKCDLDSFTLGDTAVTGQVCYLGPLDGPDFNAGNFDPNTGDYYVKESGGIIRKIDFISLLTFTGYESAAVAEAVDQVKPVTTTVVSDTDLNPLADFNIAKFSAPGIFGGAEDTYLVGCNGNKVILQSLTTPANFIRITMTDFGAVPAGQSGATWLFAGDTTNPDIYCAYNNGANGVIQVNVTGTFNDGTEDKIPAGFVSSSRGTQSNDGLNCMKVDTPFPPAGTAPPPTTRPPTTTTTETTTTTTTTESTESTTTTESTDSTRTTMSTETTRTPMSTTTMETTRTTETAPDPGSSTTTDAATTTTTTTTTSTDEPTTSKKPYGRHRRFRRWFPFRRHGRGYDQHGYRYS